MHNIRYLPPDGSETSVAAQSYEVTDAGAQVTVRAWDAIMKDRPPIGAWSGARKPGAGEGVARVLIANRFGAPIETVYFLPGS